MTKPDDTNHGPTTMTQRLTQRLDTLIQSDTTIGVILCLLGPPLMLIDIYGGGLVLTLGLILIIVDRLKGRPPSSDRPQDPTGGRGNDSKKG